MNDKIIDIAKQAGFPTDYNNRRLLHSKEIEVFAKMLNEVYENEQNKEPDECLNVSTNIVIEQVASWLENNCEEQFLADRIRAGDYTKEKSHTENCAAFTDNCPDHLSPSLVGVGDSDYTTKKQDQPIAWMHENGSISFIQGCGYKKPLYATLQQCKPLTDEQIKKVWGIHDHDDDPTNIVYERDITKAIEAAHGIKE